MTETQWIIVAASFLGGGAMGAIITALITSHRNRPQPVGYTKEVIDVFKTNPNYSSLQAVFRLGKNKEAEGFAVDNFSLARFTLVNKGNQDIQEFKFGITLGGTNEAVDMKMHTPGRLHVISSSMPVTFGFPAKEIDLTLQPFNRRDIYTVDVYITYKDTLGRIEISTAHSCNLVELGATAKLTRELLLQAFKESIRGYS